MENNNEINFFEILDELWKEKLKILLISILGSLFFYTSFSSRHLYFRNQIKSK